jgi:hypothetical protein
MVNLNHIGPIAEKAHSNMIRRKKQSPICQQEFSPTALINIDPRLS